MRRAHRRMGAVLGCLLAILSVRAVAEEGGRANAGASQAEDAGQAEDPGQSAALDADGVSPPAVPSTGASDFAGEGGDGAAKGGVGGEAPVTSPKRSARTAEVGLGRTSGARSGAPGVQGPVSGVGNVSMRIFSAEEVTVTAKRSRSLDLPGSIDVIGEEQISKEATTNSLDLMRQIPGFAYHDYGNGGVPNGFMMRGFVSNHGNDTLVVVDGIPINEHGWFGQDDGAPDFNQLTSEEIERIEVIKGPLDARYGNWARSGIVLIQTRQAGNFTRADVSGGEYGNKKAYVTFGSEHFDGRFNQVYSAEVFQLDGWRENSAQQRMNAYAKWFYKPSADVRLGLMTHVYKADWSTGSYIGEDKWRQDPRQAFSGAENDGGYKKLAEISLHLDAKILHRCPLQFKLWRRASVNSRYADWSGLGTGQTEDHGRENVTGGLLNVESDWELAPYQTLRVDAGIDYRYFLTNGQNWNTRARERQLMNSDNRYVFQNGGGYLKASYDVARRVRFSAGIREDVFWGSATDRVADANSTMKTYSVPTYKGGVVGNVFENLSLYGNAGTSFRLPGKESKYLRAPPPVASLLFWEVGLKATYLDLLMLRYAYFQSTEPTTLFVEGQYVDDGKARRAGHEVELSAGPWRGVEIFTALTVHSARYLGGENDGKQVPIVPGFIWKLGVQAEAPWGTGGRVSFSDLGKWYTDASNEHSYGGYQVVDLSVYQTFANYFSIALDVRNLLDVKYAEFVSFWGGSNQYMPSNPRTWLLSLRYSS